MGKGMLSKHSCLTASVVAVSVLLGCAGTRALTPPIGPTVRVAPTAPVPVTRPGTEWSINDEALRIIEDSEGLRLHAYHLAGQVLIGYGHAVAGATDPQANDDLTISAREARSFLRRDVAICEDAVRRVLKVNVTRNQFSAMVAFCYNVGQATLMNSSIVRHVNSGEEARAADAFLLYNKAAIETEKRPVAVLTERRIKERYLFLASASPIDSLVLRR